MGRTRSDVVVHGIIGGVVAGAVIALWFLIVDVAAGSPLRTPATIAAIAFGSPGGAASGQLIATYTVLHFAIFAALGLTLSLVMHALGLQPSVRLGALVGVGVLNVAHYGALLVTGSTLLNVLPPIQVLGANLCAGIALMTYLHFALAPEVPFGVGVLRAHSTLVEGLITGAVGAGAVALWFLLLDIVRGQPFFTPAALGSVLFFGAVSGDQVRVTVGIVLAYTALHLAAFAAVGVVAHWSAERLERASDMWLMAFIAVVTIDGIFLGIVGGMVQWTFGSFGIWAVVIANLLAIGAMATWILVRHPKLREVLRDPVATRV